MRGVWTNRNPIQAGLWTYDDIQHNAREIWGFFQPRGWTLNAVCGMLGNMESESYINPAQWQLGGIIEDPNPQNVEGFGLVQWTPWQKYVDSSDWFGDWQAGSNWRTDYIKQLHRIQYEVDFDIQYPNQGQWINTGAATEYMSFYDFTLSTETPEDCAIVFFNGYERGTGSTAPRQAAARQLFEYLSEVGPLPPSGGHLPIWLLFKMRERWSG